MKKSRVAILTSASAVALLIAILIPSLSATGSSAVVGQYPSGSSYAAIPAGDTTAFGVTLDELTNAQLSQVAVTTQQAIAVANSHQFETVPSGDDPTVTLGSFTDSEWGSNGAATTGDLVAFQVPAFVVTFSDVQIASSGPNMGSNSSPAMETGSYSVVVNADTGDYIMAYAG